MRINKNTDSTMFYWYNFSKAYRKMSYAERAFVAERHVKSCNMAEEFYAHQYCLMNSIEASNVAEEMAHWLKFNIRVNDMLYSDFKVDYISDSFFEVARQNTFKLLSTAFDLGGLYNCLGLCSGTMIFDDCLVQYAVREDGILITSDYRNKPQGEGMIMTAFPKEDYEDGIFEIEKNEHIEQMPDLARKVYFALAILILKKFGEVETQIVAGNTRRKSLCSDEIIMNSMPFPVTQVDSMWLRTIIRTEGFLVRGHFRFQACGERHRDRKLIYIEPFQKFGYVRRAGKLIAEERAYAAA